MAVLWPFSAIESIVFQAALITALWPKPESASMDGALAAATHCSHWATSSAGRLQPVFHAQVVP
jgi:hypothetical protein